MLKAFFEGWLLALSLIIPLGVQNVFILNQGATQQSYWRALPSVLTAAICDTVLILMAILGVSLLIISIPIIKMVVLIMGCIFLLYMVRSMWLSSPHTMKGGYKALSIKKQVIFSASVSLCNPHALLDTVAVIGSSALQFSGSTKVMFTVACISISWCWFFILSLLGHFIKKVDISGTIMNKINKISAIMMLAVVIYILFNLMHNKVF